MVSLILYLSRTAGHGKHRDLVQVNQNRLVMNSVQHWFRLVRTNTRHLTEIPRTEMAWRFFSCHLADVPCESWQVERNLRRMEALIVDAATFLTSTSAKLSRQAKHRDYSLGE